MRTLGFFFSLMFSPRAASQTSNAPPVLTEDVLRLAAGFFAPAFHKNNWMRLDACHSWMHTLATPSTPSSNNTVDKYHRWQTMSALSFISDIVLPVSCQWIPSTRNSWHASSACDFIAVYGKALQSLADSNCAMAVACLLQRFADKRLASLWHHACGWPNKETKYRV